jgi:NADPH:quinone reductase-like Zn-dependent oxidoreductase
MKYRSVVAVKRGGPEVLQVVENEVRDPAKGEVRIRILATSVGGTDINYRYGLSPLAPRAPFVPGYEIMGMVDAIGPAVTGFSAGERVAALTGHGGYTEMITLRQDHLVRVPAGLDPADVVTLVLNYASAYQMLHRVAKARPGQKALIIGASGGVGSALLQLGRLAGLEMYGTASPEKHGLLIAAGATPIDYHSQDFVEVLRRAEPAGIDLVFDGIGGAYQERGLATLRRGGKLIAYAAPVGVAGILGGLISLGMINLLPNGKSAEFYGITAKYLRDKRPFKQDMAILFQMLQEGRIQPVIAGRLPLLEARKANERLEAGQVAGTLVLLAGGAI